MPRVSSCIAFALTGALSLLSLSACGGGADSTVVGFCQNAGDTKRNCTCIAKSLKENLPQADFEHFRSFIRETDLKTMTMEEQTAALFAMAFDPQLHTINAKYEAAKTACVKA